MKDNQMQIVDFYLSQTVAGTSDTFEDIAEKVRKVTRRDISAVSERINLETIYFLTASDSQNQ